MFIVNNGTITNDKTLNIGTYTKHDVVFKFDGQQFDYEDKFILTIANETSSLYGFLDDTGCIRFTLFPFDWIQDAETSASITVTKNGVQILSDIIIITAPELPAGQTIVNVSSLAISPENGIIYSKTLASGDAVSFNTSSLTSSTMIDFELHLAQNTSAVSFTLPNDIYWYDNGNFTSGNAAPDMSEASTKYALVFRWDGVKFLGNLAYSENI